MITLQGSVYVPTAVPNQGVDFQIGLLYVQLNRIVYDNCLNFRFITTNVNILCIFIYDNRTCAVHFRDIIIKICCANYEEVEYRCVGEYTRCVSITDVLVSITYVLVSIAYVLVSITDVLVSITDVLVSITYVGEHNICVGDYSMCWSA
jgi:hypothetical protein